MTETKEFLVRVSQLVYKLTNVLEFFLAPFRNSYENKDQDQQKYESHRKVVVHGSEERS